MVIPCRKDCEGRSVECHVYCEKYKVYTQDRERIRKKHCDDVALKDLRDGLRRCLRQKASRIRQGRKT